MKPKDNTAIRKRTQISKTNRVMLIWVAGASVVVGVALVASIYLVQKLVFNERVLAEKEKTISILDKNNKVIPDLETQIRVLDTNKALASIKNNETDQNIQVILDALPSEANSPALGASLQNKLLTGIDGLSIESLQVNPVVGVESETSDSIVDESNAVENQITFQFAVTGDQAALKQVLTNLERSIRAIEVTSLRIENQGGKQLMTVQGRAFYEPAKTIELKTKAIRS